MNIDFNNIDLENMYHLLPFYYNNDTEYVKMLKHKLAIENTYKEYPHLLQEEVEEKHKSFRMYLLNFLIRMLNRYEFSEFKEKTFNLYHKINGNDIVQYPSFSDNNEEIIFVPRSVVDEKWKMGLDTIAINAETIVTCIKNIKDNYNILDNETNPVVTEKLNSMIIKNSNYIINTAEFYDNWITTKNIDLKTINQEFTTELWKLIDLTNVLTSCYVNFEKSEKIQNVALKLDAFYSQMLLIRYINENTELDIEKHKKILIAMNTVEIKKKYCINYNQYELYFLNYVSRFYKKQINDLYKLYNETTNTDLKNYYKNNLILELSKLNAYGHMDEEYKKIFNEVRNIESKIRNNFKNDNVEVSQTNISTILSETRPIEDLQFKDVAKNDNDLQKIIPEEYFVTNIGIICWNEHRLSNQEVTSTPSIISTLIIESTKVFKHYYENSDFSKGLEYIVKNNKASVLNNEIKLEQNININWTNVIEGNVMMIKHMIENIKILEENLKITEEDYVIQTIKNTINNSYERIENNYNFFNSDLFKNDLINNIDIELIKYIAEIFYNTYIFTNKEKHLKLFNELVQIYLVKLINKFNNNFTNIFSIKNLHLISAGVTLLTKFYKCQNETWLNVYETYRNNKFKHYMNLIEKYENEYNHNTNNVEKLYIGLLLIENISKANSYQKVDEKYKNIFIELSSNYNFIDSTLKLIHVNRKKNTFNNSSMIIGNQIQTDFNTTDKDLISTVSLLHYWQEIDC